LATVLAALALRPEDPAAPWPGGKPPIELAGCTFEVSDDERDLKGRNTVE
jgi:hypothetical protein